MAKKKPIEMKVRKSVYLSVSSVKAIPRQAFEPFSHALDRFIQEHSKK